MRILENLNIALSDKRPEYFMVLDAIKNRIHKGEIKPGDKIYSERYFSAEFNVSQIAVKKALMILKNEGYIYSIPGKGNFVCKKEFDPYALYFDEMMSDDGTFDEIQIININIVKPDFDICNRLLIPENRNVIVIERRYLRERRIKVLEEKYIPYTRGVPLIEWNLKQMPIDEINGLNKISLVATKKLNIRATLANKKICQLLDILEGEAVLVVDQILFDEKDRPIEWRVLHFAEAEQEGLNAVTSFV